MRDRGLQEYNEEKDLYDEEDYNEEEDEDFKPNDERVQLSEDEIDGSESRYPKDDKSNDDVDYSHIESDKGGLIKTRRARLLQDDLDRKRKYEYLDKKAISESIKDVWEELKDLSDKRMKLGSSSGSILSDRIHTDGTLKHGLREETITIKRDYVFAGEVIHEEKSVLINSAEAQEYLNSIKFQQKPLEKSQSSSQPRSAMEANKQINHSESKFKKFQVSADQLKKLRRPLRRPPILEQIISGSLKPKLTTLEKSSLDWATYVDKEGINDELTLHNKDGYLAKQDFLNKVEHHKDSQYKQLRQKQLALQAQENR